MTSNQQLALRMYDEGSKRVFGLAGDSQKDTRQHIFYLLSDCMTKTPKAKCGVTALDAAVKAFRESHPTPRETTPHAGKFLGGACTLCGLPPESPLHTYTLPGFQDVLGTREQAKAEAIGEELTARMRQPIKNISHKAGNIERDAPLFYGTCDNPTLF